MDKRRLFALSDPHLSFAKPKTMDIFGPHWRNHAERLGENWRRTVGDDDIVLLTGDISWAMRLEEARVDLEWLSKLPGKKIILKGNHDYWWASLSKLNALAMPKLHFLQTTPIILGDGALAVGGTRLWDFPFVVWRFPQTIAFPAAAIAVQGKADKSVREPDPEKIRQRELERLDASLKAMPAAAKLKVIMTHYPPLGSDGETTPLTQRIGQYGIDMCVFGHVHGPYDRDNPRPGEDIVVDGVRYILTSSDYLEHTPKLLAEF